MNYDGENWELRNVEQWLKALFCSIPDLILFKDGDGRWIFASDYTLSLFGLGDHPYIGKTSAELSQITSVSQYREILLSRDLAEEHAWKLRKTTRTEVEFPLIHGRSIILDVIISPIFNEDGSRSALVVIGRDITDRKIAEERAKQLAYYDQLTKLPNRYMFEKELENYLIISNTLQQRFILMYLDIDRFKQINNSLGPAVGDQLLIDISQRLQQSLEEDNFLAHMGGDEFAVLIPNQYGLDKAVQTAESMIACISKPFFVSNYELYLTMTIGICCYPQDGKDVQTLMKNADIALTLAKERGKNRYLIFNANMDVATFKMFSLENSLNKAMQNDQFEIYYQPKVEIGTNRIVGAEALIRWNHPEWGLTSPQEFIPLAEETGLIIPIGEWIIRTVCQQNKQWQDAGLNIVPISVNSSVKQFMQKDFLTNIKRILTETGLEPHYLEIEITETSLIDNEKLVIKVINHLREFGLRVALDDFGTGYSVLSHLKLFNVDTIKIDRSFIQEIGTHDKSTLIVKGIIDLVKSLNIHAVAEGVETVEQLNFLQEHTCDQAQGYLYSRPVKAEVFQQLLEAGEIQFTCEQEQQEQEFVERRSDYRIPLTYPLLAEMTIIKFKDKEITLGNTEVLMCDIGPDGLSFASNIKMAVRPDMILKVTTTILGNEINFIGKIVWSKELYDNVHRYGMELLNDENERDFIVEVLNHFSVKLRQQLLLPDCRFIEASVDSFFRKQPVSHDVAL